MVTLFVIIKRKAPNNTVCPMLREEKMYKDQIEAYFRIITARLEWSQKIDHHNKWVLIRWFPHLSAPTFDEIKGMLNNQNAIILHNNKLFYADFLNRSVQEMEIPTKEATNTNSLKTVISKMATDSKLAKDKEIKLILSIRGLLDEGDSVLRIQLERAGLMETHLKKLAMLKEALVNELATPDLNLLTILPTFNRPVIFAEGLLSLYEATDQASFNARFMAFNILLIQTKQALSDRFQLLHEQKTDSADFKLKFVLITIGISLIINLHFEEKCKNRICLNGFDIASVFALILYIKDYYNRSKLDSQLERVQHTETALSNLRSDILQLKDDKQHPGFFATNHFTGALFQAQTVGLKP